LTANNTVQTTLTMTATTADAALRRFGIRDPHSGIQVASAGPAGQTAHPANAMPNLLAALAVPFDFSGLAAFAAGLLKRRRTRNARIIAVLLVVALFFMVLGLASCGCPSTAHQIYTITVTGTGGAGTPTHAAILSLVVD
jgi:uncharacterized membrane protein